MSFFSNKVVWITGASSGIGEALAYVLAKRDAILILSARNIDALEKVKSNCNTSKEILSLSLDLTNRHELESVVNTALQAFGKIDILINNAGQSQRSLAFDSNEQVYRQMMEVNFFGTIQLTRLLLPHFIKRNEGKIVVMSSVAGITGLPYRTAYSAAKHALEGFFGALRVELWKTNITVLMVRSGAVKTRIAYNALIGNGDLNNHNDPIIENGKSPEAVANAIIEAIVSNKKILNIGSTKEKILFVLNRFIPSIVFNFLKKLVP